MEKKSPAPLSISSLTPASPPSASPRVPHVAPPPPPPRVLVRRAPRSSASFARSLRTLTAPVGGAGHERASFERRAEARRVARLGCRVHRVDDGRLIADRVLDLSPRGMLVLSNEAIEPGTVVSVSFQTTEPPVWFDTQAHVTRVVEGRRAGDAGRAIGLRFDSLSAVSRFILRGHLRKLPLTRPARRPPLRLTAREPNYAQVVADIWRGR